MEKSEQSQIRELENMLKSRDAELQERRQQVRKQMEVVESLQRRLQGARSKNIILAEEKQRLQDENYKLKFQHAETIVEPFLSDISEIDPKKSSSTDEESGGDMNASTKQKIAEVLHEIEVGLAEQEKSESMNDTTMSQEEQDGKKKKYETAGRIVKTTMEFALEFVEGYAKKKAEEHAGMSPDAVDKFVDGVKKDVKSLISIE